jgi:ATP-dependent DNA ligase
VPSSYSRGQSPNAYSIDHYRLLRKALPGLHLNEHLAQPGDVVFRHACKMGFEGIVSKRLGSRYTSGRTRDWLKFKNPAAPAVKREAEEEWGRER